MIVLILDLLQSKRKNTNLEENICSKNKNIGSD